MLRVWRVIKNDNLMKPKTFFPGDFNALHQHKSVSFMVNIEIKVWECETYREFVEMFVFDERF